MKRYKLYSEKEKKLIIKYYSVGGAGLVRKYIKDRTLDSINHKANSMGIKCSKESKIDFDDMMYNFTEKSSYLLGFIWADGNIFIDEKNNHFNLGILLAEKDFNEFLKKGLFNRFHIYKSKSKKYPAKKVYIGHKKLVLFLKNNDFNIKSQTTPTKILSLIPKDLHRHFFRGWFDGDGCLTALKNDRWRIAISGGYTQDWSEVENKCKEFNIKYKIIRRIQKTGRNSCIQICGIKQVNILLNYIYKDSKIHLNRKHDMYFKSKNKIINRFLNSNNKYIGVRPHQNKFRVRVYHNGRTIEYGCFDTQDEAAINYNYNAKKLLKDSAELNILGRNFYLDYYGLLEN